MSDNIKTRVRRHTLQPFNVSELNVTNDLAGNKQINIGDQFKVSSENVKKLLSYLGVKDNLKRNSFHDPEVRWSSLRTALENCNTGSDLGAIVNDRGATVNIVRTTATEPQQLDYSDRIDNALDAIDQSSHDVHSVEITDDCRVKIKTRDQGNEVNCGNNDIWQSGIEVELGHNKQEFNSFYLRLICSNGMTTNEKVARRLASVNNLSNQLTRFISQNDFTSLLRNKVDLLRNECASVYEVNQIVQALNTDDREEFTPWYQDVKDIYERSGRPLHNMSAKQQKLAFTDQNLYDVFNTGTYLATHHANRLGEGTCMELNTACANMFKYGPNLKLRTLNPYARANAAANAVVA